MASQAAIRADVPWAAVGRAHRVDRAEAALSRHVNVKRSEKSYVPRRYPKAVCKFYEAEERWETDKWVVVDGEWALGSSSGSSKGAWKAAAQWLRQNR